jgi:hypothetical protein
VRRALREVPNVPNFKLLNLVISDLINRRDQDLPRIDITPFSLLNINDDSLLTIQMFTYHSMPMKLAYSSLVEMLLSGSNIGARREISDNLLASPTAVKDPGLGVTEAPFQIWNDSAVGRLLSEIVGVGQVNLMISTT